MILTSVSLIAAMLQAGNAIPAGVAAPPGDKPVCKRITETGSIVGHRKICHSKAEWDKIAWAARQGAQSLQDGGMQRPPGGN